MPATLLSFWNDEVTRLKDLLAKARLQITAEGKNEGDASAALASTSKNQEKARTDVESARKALSGIPMPADGDPLLLQMRAALAALNIANAGQVEKDMALRQARAARLRTSDLVKSLEQHITEAEKQKKTETNAAGLRLIWSTAAKTAPLKNLPALANTALGSFETSARTKVENNFPANADPDKNFLNRVRARRVIAGKALDQARGIFNDAQDTSTAWEESSTRANAKIAALRRGFDEKVAALKALYDAPARVRQAQDQLKALASQAASPLTASQKADLFGTGKAALQTKREDTLKLLAVRDNAQNDLLGKQEIYANTLLSILLANPGKTESELLVDDATLKGKKKDVADAEKAMSDASSDAAFVAGITQLQDWFSAVPDTLWEQFETLETACADLKVVQAIVPATLLSDIDTAESLLVSQMEAARNEQITIAQRNLSLQQGQDLFGLASELAPRRLQMASRFIEPI